MPHVVVRAPRIFEDAFRRIRAELDVPVAFPDAVLAEAEAAVPPDVERVDARHLGFVAIDPPGATDLDQAFAAEALADGYRIYYAIADVAAFLRPGGAVDTEARRRGLTLYSPDERAPLHPPILSEDRASLLPGSDKPALLWTIDLDADGAARSWRLERALVHVREAISYRDAQDRIDGQATGVGPLSDVQGLGLLATIGRLRQAREAERGGVSLNLPAQEIVSEDGHYALSFDQPLPVEGWNAQISLLAGMVAGQTMIDAGVGVLRTLPPARGEDIEVLRRTAAALGLAWSDDVDYARFVRSLAPTTPAANAFLVQCTRLFKGAGYFGFNGDTRPDNVEHSAIASVYSHVTAPLRRLVDRFGNEILLAHFAGVEPPAWAVEALDELPSLMGQARQRESSLERAILDASEALVLEHRIGEVFDSVVVDVVERSREATVQIAEPAVVARVPGEGLSLAEQVKLRLNEVDVEARSILFDPITG